MSDYNGWKNRQTWNIALHINGDEIIYRNACRLVSAIGKKPTIKQTQDIVDELFDEMTSDGVSTIDRAIDWKAIREVLEEARSRR
jgi:hypothetical protein